MPITLRSAKGAPLTHAELDANWALVSVLAASLLLPQWNGAVANGVANDTTPVATVTAGDGIKIFKTGNYLTPGAVASFAHPTLILADNAQQNGTYLPFIAITQPTVNFKNTPQVHAFVLQNTTYRSDARTVDIRRWVNTDDGHTNPHALHVETIKYHSNSQCEWAISGVIYSYNTVADNGSCAVSGSSFKMVDGGAGLFAGHFQARDEFKAAADTTVTGCIGTETNVMAIGDDHPTLNQIGTSGRYAGARWGHVYIPITNTGISGWDTATGNYGEVIAGAAIHIHNDNPTRSNGTWRTGIVIRDISGNPNPIDHAIHINTNGGRSIWLTGNVTGTHFQVSGNAANGIVLSGSYSSNAIRINAQQNIAMEATGVVKMAYGVTGTVWGFYNDSNERAGFIITASPGLRLNGTQVVGTRSAGWTAMTGSGSKGALAAAAAGTVSAGYVQAEHQSTRDRVAAVEARLKSYDDAWFTHGLIGA